MGLRERHLKTLQKFRRRGFSQSILTLLLFNVIAACLLLFNSSTGFLLQRSSSLLEDDATQLRPATHETLPSRRHIMSGAGLLLGDGLLSQHVLAEEQPRRGWQMKLPEEWMVVRQTGLPGPDETRTKELLLAANGNAEVRILRIPLVTSERDPQGLGGLALIEYFSAEKPRVTREQILPLLSQSFASQPATFELVLSSIPEDIVKSRQKYLLYEFDLTRCEGSQVQGTKGKLCQRSDNGEILPTSVRHHAVLNTVTAEPGGGSLAGDGAYPEVFWLIDFSAPSDIWPQVLKQVRSMVDTFSIGSETALEASRNATLTK